VSQASFRPWSALAGALVLLSALPGCGKRTEPAPAAVKSSPVGVNSVAPAPEAGPTRYVGRAACVKCHAEQGKSWLGSDHDRAMEEPTAESVKGDFSGARFTHSGEHIELSTNGAGYVAIITRKGERPRSLPVKYTFGVDPLQQYLVDVGRGRLQALAVAWDTRPKAAGGQRWFHLHEGEKLAPGSRRHWESPAYNWNSMCADCHSTGVEQNYDRTSDSYTTKYAEIDVSCEACHGKGSRHVAWAEAKAGGRAGSSAERGFSLSLVKPKERRWVLAEGANIATLQGALPNDRELDACGPCHARRSDLGPGDGERASDRYRLALLEDRLYFADGQIREEDFELGSFLQSKMHARGVTCSDCHEPHSLSLRAEGNALCANCHRASHYDAPAHHFHAAGTPSAACVSCHMPTTTYMRVDPRHDHRFGVPRPAHSEKLGAPDVCTGCHAGKSAAWADAEIAKRRTGTAAPDARGDAFWLAWNGQPGAGRALFELIGKAELAPVVRATALAALANYPSRELPGAIRSATADPDPLVRRAAAEVARSLPPQERWPLIGRLLADPARTVRVDAAGALLDAPASSAAPETVAQLKRALAEYVAAREYNADHAEALVDLAELALRSGDHAEAERLLRTAMRKEPSFSAAHLNLADLFRERGDEEKARETLMAGLASAEDRPMLEHALGLALIREKRPKEALERLRAAYDAAPDRPRFGYVYAVALFDTGTQARALEVLEKMHERRPGDAQVLSALADYARRLGRAEAAAEYARKLRALTEGAAPRTP
jgi:Tfp pilus assembly protein PilF